ETFEQAIGVKVFQFREAQTQKVPLTADRQLDLGMQFRQYFVEIVPIDQHGLAVCNRSGLTDAPIGPSAEVSHQCHAKWRFHLRGSWSGVTASSHVELTFTYMPTRFHINSSRSPQRDDCVRAGR